MRIDHATQKGIEQENDLAQHRCRDQGGQAERLGGRDRHEQGRQEQEKGKVDDTMKKIMFLITAFVLINGIAHGQGGERGGFFGLWGGYNRYPLGYRHAYGWQQPMIYSGVNYISGVSFYSAGDFYYSSFPMIYSSGTSYYSAPSAIYLTPATSVFRYPGGVYLYP